LSRACTLQRLCACVCLIVLGVRVEAGLRHDGCRAPVCNSVCWGCGGHNWPAAGRGVGEPSACGTTPDAVQLCNAHCPCPSPCPNVACLGVVVSAASFARHGCHRPVVRCLVQDGFTPLHLAATNGSCRLVDLLLRMGADVNAEDNVSCWNYSLIPTFLGGELTGGVGGACGFDASWCCFGRANHPHFLSVPCRSSSPLQCTVRR
jgi:hypothetical protein